MSFTPPILTPEDEAEIALKAAQNVAALAAPDNTSLLALAANLRARHADPKDFEFAGRPDRVAASEMQLTALLLRAGVTETPLTPEILAQRQHDAQWTQTELNPAVAALVAERVAAVDKLPEREQVARAVALRAELGADAYDRLVFEAGTAVPAAAKADAYTLKVLAANGRYRKAAAAAKPKP